MPYDPTWPQNGQNIDADRFREQFDGVITLINNASSITGVAVDAVDTLPPGNPAEVLMNLQGSVLHFTFRLPQGIEGMPGPMGPAFANAVVDSVTTLNPGEAASVQTSFDGSNVHFTFAIPRGSDGNQGNNGSDGAQGPPGEVTNVQLAAAIADTSHNTNSINTLDSAFADPDMETLRAKVNELILNGRR